MKTARMEDFLARLFKARADAGLSQAQVAQRLGFTSSSVISHYESGKREITVETLFRLCDVYHVQPEQVIAGRRTYTCPECNAQMWREDSMLHTAPVLHCSYCGYEEYD